MENKRVLDCSLRLNKVTREELASLKRGKDRYEDTLKRLIGYWNDTVHLRRLDPKKV